MDSNAEQIMDFDASSVIKEERERLAIAGC